jgi:hypothetical protein
VNIARRHLSDAKREGSTGFAMARDAPGGTILYQTKQAVCHCVHHNRQPELAN